jgi:hypothetical protein
LALAIWIQTAKADCNKPVEMGYDILTRSQPAVNGWPIRPLGKPAEADCGLIMCLQFLWKQQAAVFIGTRGHHQ